MSKIIRVLCVSTSDETADTTLFSFPFNSANGEYNIIAMLLSVCLGSWAMNALSLTPFFRCIRGADFSIAFIHLGLETGFVELICCVIIIYNHFRRQFAPFIPNGADMMIYWLHGLAFTMIAC